LFRRFYRRAILRRNPSKIEATQNENEAGQGENNVEQGENNVEQGEDNVEQGENVVELDQNNEVQQKWQTYTKYLRGPPDATITRRIVGMLYRNQQLENKIKELKDSVDNLNKSTIAALQLHGHGITSEALELWRYNNVIQRASEQVYAAYIERKNAGEALQWTIETRIPENGTEEEIRSMLAERIVTFLVKRKVDAISAEEVHLKHLEGDSLPDQDTPLVTKS
jgi:predicted RNase H-like nuclease (RuvC/YqgF family)